MHQREGKRAKLYTDIVIWTILFASRGGSRAEASGSRRGRFKESSLSEVADDERNRHQRDADANGSEELVDGVGQDERAGSSCHSGLNHGLAEAQFAQDGRHVDPAVERRDAETQLELHRVNM